MPNKMIYALSKKHKVPVKELESKWQKAKKIVIDEYGTVSGKYGVLMTIFKRMTNLSEDQTLSFKKFMQIDVNTDEKGD